MRTCVVTISEAKTNLSRLIRKAANGEEVVISRRSKPVARLVPISEVRGRRRPGSMKGRLEVGPDFFRALPVGESAARE